MRILHVITTLQTGGAERLMVDLLPRLKCNGHEVELVVFDGADTPFMDQIINKGIKVNRFSKGGSVYNPYYIIKLIILMKSFDIIHAHNTSPQFFVAIASLFTRNILFTTEHNTANRRRNWPFFRFVDKWMYNRYKEVICISDQAKINLENYLKHSETKIDTVYNGIDVKKFFDAEPCQEIAKRFIGCNVITMVAGFRKQKDQGTLIKALNYLPDNFHLILVGDGETRPDLEKVTSDLGYSDRVHFLGVRMDVADILKSSDLVIMSSHYEGLSLSNVEGMASGKPFIASNVDGLREVTEGYGVLFPEGDSEVLSNIILRLLNEREYYDSVVKKCTERALQYDIELMVNRYNYLYNLVR